MRRHEVPLGCFGKLPCWREYLAVRVADDASQALRDWLQASRAAWLADVAAAGEEPAESGSWRFILSPAKSRWLLAGSIGPSRDAGGRSFPFATFVSVPRDAYTRRFGVLPLALERTWSALDDLRATLVAVEDRDSFDRIVGDSAVPEPLARKRAWEAYRAGLASDASHLRADGRPLSPGVVAAGLPRLVQKLKNSQRESVRLDLPVASALDQACRDTSFWLELVNDQFFWKQWSPSVFVDARSEVAQRRALLAFGALGQADYGLLFGVAADRTGLMRPADPPKARRSPTAARQRAAAAGDQEGAEDPQESPPEPEAAPGPARTYDQLAAEVAAASKGR